MQRREMLRMTASMAAFPASWAVQVARADWKPSVLDEHQNETVVALSDLIVPATDTPGAKAANVNRYVDLFLREGPADDRKRFLSGLAFLDGYAKGLYGHLFVECSGAEQAGMLTSLEHDDGAGGEFFRRAKTLVTHIYYNTEIGYRELNKGGRVPATFACRHTQHG